MILITGATGTIGRTVGARVRVLATSVAKASSRRSAPTSSGSSADPAARLGTGHAIHAGAFAG